MRVKESVRVRVKDRVRVLGPPKRSFSRRVATTFKISIYVI